MRACDATVRTPPGAYGSPAGRPPVCAPRAGRERAGAAERALDAGRRTAHTPARPAARPRRAGAAR
ncbi:hypothetical protein SGLAU_05175 [Streptomyces glaucescens]|uniref:Uncharacterized protein n=1 Tax=Streptomyces glaucescens TaxID=1907 RepID=A0A089X5C8_STRGA|nr:hypothetical protein SGLAU_05175 [Streptomyces glaucescens]